MTGGQLQEAVIELAHLFEWKVAHFRPAKTSKGWRTAVEADGKGWPDLTLVHERGVVLFREIKGEREALKPEQKQWGEWLTAAGANYAVWRPKDMDLIKHVLSFGRAS